MKGILGQIKKDSDIVIMDSPPVLVVTDAVILSPQVDGVLLVVQPGKTKIPAAKETVDQLKRAKANILGVVIKFVEGKRNRGTGRYGYYTRSRYDSYYRADEISDEDADFGGQGNAIKTKK
jgi:Mrp family chromosome partitioning ATPase